GDNVSMTINGQDYGATVGNDDTWSVDVAGSDLAADSAFDVTVDSTDDAGNTVTTTGSSTHGVDLLAGITVSLDDVNAENAGNAPIGGTTSDVEQGQTVSLAITDGTSTVNATATVGADGSYETNADLSELVDGNLDVTATVTDQAGNSATATDTAVLDAVNERPMADPVSTTADIFDASVSVPSGVSTDPLLFKQFSVDGTVDGNAPEPSPTLGGTDAETPLDELTFTLESIPTSGTLFIDIEGDGTYTSALIGDEFSNDSTFYWLDDGSGSNTINVDFSQAPAADSGITLYAYGYDGVQDNTLLNFQGNGVGVSDDTDNNLQEQVPNQLGYRDGKSQTLVMDFDGPAHGAEISVSRLIKNEGEVGKVEAYLDGEQVGAWTFSGVDGATLNGESVDFNIGGSNGGFNLPDGIAFDQLRFTATEYADGYQANGSSNDSSEYFVDSISYQTFSPAEFEYRVNDSDGAESDSVKVEIGVPETNTDVPESFESGAPSITVVTPEAMTVDEAFLEAGTRAGEVPADGEPGATANGQFTLNAPAGLGILSIAAAGLTSGDAGFANGQVTLNAGQLATLGNDPVVIETPEGNTLRLTGLDADSGTVDFRFELNQAVTNVDGEPLDKAPISLELTDANGTTAQATLNVAILDDGVDTTDDPLAITAGGTAEGNVLDNDSGADVDLEVTSVAFAGIEQPVPENGDSITIAGDNGTLTIGRDGAYSYQANAVEPVNIQGSSADIWETQTAGLWGFDASTTIPLEGDGGLDLTALSTGNDNITFNGGEKSGVGVKVKGGANTIDDGESILIQLEDSTDQLTVGINRFNEAQEKFGFWTAYNDDGDVVGSGGFSGLNNNGDRFELAIETTESFSYLQMGLDTGDVNNNSGYVIDELSYTPTHQFEQDSFTYTVVDQDGSTAEGTLSAFMHSDDLTPFIGTEGDDPLVGSDADEAFAGLAGDDTLTGGLGDDVFKWTLTDQGDTNAPANDVITDFGTGNDVLDLRDLLVDETEQTIGDFLSVEQDGGDLVFQVTHDGGSDGATQTIRLEGKQFADFGGAENSSELIQNMLDSGQLKIDT
ncbi:type I secretion C-terminal target domain-containing protein, partial [Guyparkeria sp. 1SP6A2]|nr:type I secretion C-terminal target domain-containing protein [Guyparkeria sp. 1SP6A2]